MIPEQTQVNLALYIGETYCEIEARSESGQIFCKKNIFLPQTSLKNLLAQCKKEIPVDNEQIKSLFVVTRYLEKLKTFRLGGSVIQLIHEGLENNYTLADSTQISLAASSLIVPVKKTLTASEVKAFLEIQFEKIQKINPDSDKVVLHLDPSIVNPNTIQVIELFFAEKNFKIFKNEQPHNLLKMRQTLLNAGTEGTKEELVKEITEAFPHSKVFFWVKDSFVEKFENTDLFFSYSDLLGYTTFIKNKSHPPSQILQLDIEQWLVLENKVTQLWKSPWGMIDRAHYTHHLLSVHPLTEIYIDQNALLQFSKSPVPSEPGPMVAGRSVKSVILDLFFEELLDIKTMKEMFPQLPVTLTQNKILSQFKVIEHGQKSDQTNYSLNELKKFIIELIHFDLGRLGYKLDTQTIYGHLAPLIKNTTTPSWTELIFNAHKITTER